MGKLKIDTALIKETGSIEKIVESYTCEALKDQVKSQSFTVKFKLEDLTTEYLLNGDLAGELILECSRCLKEYSSKMELNFINSYQQPVDEIDVSQEVDELIVINLPQKPLCDEDCKGLCQKCFINLNESTCSCDQTPKDIRWEKLNTLLKK